MPPEINSGDTAWMLAAAALVMFMTPGLGFFYAGFTRSKNVLATIMQSFIVVGLVGVLWVLIGYTLAFGPTEGGIIGKLDFIGFKDVGIIPADKPVVGEVTWAPTIPHEAFAIFQAMFAIITPALITGAFAERAKFSTFLIFMAAWFTARLRAGSPLDFWSWLARHRGLGWHKRAGLRRRRGDPRQCRCRRIGRGPALRQAQGLRQRTYGTTQRHLHCARRGDPVVRLVRLQRR